MIQKQRRQVVKTISLVIVVWVSITTVSYGQVSASDVQRAYDIRQRQIDNEKEREKYLRVGHELFGTSSYLKKVPYTDIQVGNWGRTHDYTTFRILNKISDTECLLTVVYTGIDQVLQKGDAILLRGLSTTKVVNGKQFILQHPFVVETYTYTTVLGRQNTVPLLDCDNKKVNERIEYALTRVWTVNKSSLFAKFVAIRNNRVYLECKNSQKTIDVPISHLSKEDRTWIQTELKPFRNWADSTGKFSVIAEFIRYKSGQVYLRRRENGKEIELSMVRLSKEDQKWVRDELRRRLKMKRDKP